MKKKEAKLKETCFLSVKKIKILHGAEWDKTELLQLARDISNGRTISYDWDINNMSYTTNDHITTEWSEQ